MRKASASKQSLLMQTLEEIIPAIKAERRPRILFLENKQGERMALVSARETLDEGVLILADRIEQTGPFVVFQKAPERRFPIVSLRRPPELCGIDEPAMMDEEALRKWAKPYTKAFYASLQNACEKGGIQTLYLAASASWQKSPYAEFLKDITVKNVTEDVIF